MATTFRFEIVTPDKMLFESDNVVYVGCRALTGNLGVEAKHLPLIATLDVAPLKITLDDGSGLKFAVAGGFLEMKDNKCTVLAAIAEPGDDIDVARAEAAKTRAEDRLKAKAADLDVKRAQLALKKAATRIKVAGSN